MPLVLQNHDPTQPKADRGVIKVKDPWDTLNQYYIGTGRNFAAQIKSIKVRSYFSRCCDDTRIDLHAKQGHEVSDGDIDPLQLGLSNHGFPLRPPPTPKEITEKGADAFPRRFATMTLSDGTDPRHSSAQQ
jgi:hypothetical protein